MRSKRQRMMATAQNNFGKYNTSDSRRNGSTGRIKPLALAPATAVVQRKADCSCGGGCPRCNGKKNREKNFQTKLPMSVPGDFHEQEADRIADKVIGMSQPAVPMKTREIAALNKTVAPAISSNKRVQAKTTPTHSETTATEASPHTALLGTGGMPMPASLRDYFEPRFGQDFSRVKLHTTPRAATKANEMSARAFTIGNNIAFADQQYQPDSTEGKRLLAHELTHVVQQRENKTSSPVIRRQTIGTGCAEHQADIEAAWAEGSRLATETITTLDNALTAINYGIAPSPTVSNALQNSFGDIGLTPGDLTFLPQLIRNYRSILAGFASGKTLRCDPESLGADRNECDWRAAFVVVGNSTDIFLCPSMFAADVSVTSRGLTLLHEMAHSVLRATHAGTPERTYPSAFFDCGISLELEWEDAKRNAFAYDRLSDCLHGERPSSSLVTPAVTATAGSSDSRWSISASAGADVTPNAYRFASALSTRVSLRTGEFVIFNPTIGFNLLYLPSSDLNSSHLAAATADIGLRIQQPLDGFYFDIAAGGYAGFDIDPTRPDATRPTGGPTASAGLGWRFQSLELGPEVRALVPEAEFDHTQVIVFGRAAYRF
jgi:hypothetical protein